MYGRAEISELLIKTGCSINIRNEHNEPALHLICHQSWKIQKFNQKKLIKLTKKKLKFSVRLA